MIQWGGKKSSLPNIYLGGNLLLVIDIPLINVHVINLLRRLSNLSPKVVLMRMRLYTKSLVDVG